MSQIKSIIKISIFSLCITSYLLFAMGPIQNQEKIEKLLECDKNFFLDLKAQLVAIIPIIFNVDLRSSEEEYWKLNKFENDCPRCASGDLYFIERLFGYFARLYSKSYTEIKTINIRFIMQVEYEILLTLSSIYPPVWLTDEQCDHLKILSDAYYLGDHRRDNINSVAVSAVSHLPFIDYQDYIKSCLFLSELNKTIFSKVFHVFPNFRNIVFGRVKESHQLFIHYFSHYSVTINKHWMDLTSHFASILSSYQSENQSDVLWKRLRLMLKVRIRL